jgi:predicted RNase H-like HicB family nuclease
VIIIEKTLTGFSAYSPDVAGCVATGSTKRQVKKNIREAIEFHLEGLLEEGYKIPKPRSYSTYVELPA